MTFTYQSFTSDEADSSLWNAITNKINGLTSTQQASIKVGASDMKGKDARAIIIYTESDAPSPKTLGKTWTTKTFSTGSNYDDMYKACVDYLNTTSDLNDTEKYYARLSFTNAANNTSTLVLYYQNQV